MESSITQVTLAKGNKLIAVPDNKPEAKPHFNMIGSGRPFMKDKRLPAVDLLKEMANMNSNESFAFITLRDSIEYDPYKQEYLLNIQVDQSKFTSYQKKQFKLGVASLIDKDLVRRKKRGIYVINPMALIAKNFRLSEDNWNKLKQKEK